MPGMHMPEPMPTSPARNWSALRELLEGLQVVERGTPQESGMLLEIIARALVILAGDYRAPHL